MRYGYNKCLQSNELLIYFLFHSQSDSTCGNAIRQRRVDHSIATDNNVNAVIAENVNILWPPVTTYVESSIQYMKRMTIVAVSHILYLRKLFTEEYFQTETIDYLELKILNNTYRYEDTQSGFETMEGLSISLKLIC